MEPSRHIPAVQTFLLGFIHDDLSKVCQSLEVMSVEQSIDTEVIYELVAIESHCDSAVDISNNIPRVPRLQPLHLASSCGRRDVLENLISRGADVNSMLEDQETALHFACLYGRVDCVRVLVEHGCDVNQDTRGDTPLMLATACYGTSGVSGMQSYLDIASILINNGCDVNAADLQGLAPVHLAAGKEDPRLLNMLLQTGATLDIKARTAVHPNTPLIGAVSAELEDNVRMLLAAGCDVNTVVYPGLSALSCALENNALGIVLDLLEAGADPRIRSDILNVQMFLGNHNYLLVMILLVYGLDVNWQNSYDRASVLLSATRKQCLPMVKWLLLSGADINLENCLGTTPLWAAVKLNDLRSVLTLIKWNCDIDISSLEYNPLIPLVPLQLAMQMGHFSIAKKLLHFGCVLRRNWLNFSMPVYKMAEMEAFKRFLADWLSHPLSLQHWCMLVIRRQLGPGLPLKVRTLRLPSRLKKYVITGKL